MNYGELIIIAMALAMDATAYSFAYGLMLREKRCSTSLQLALATGLFQMLMPLIGYLGGAPIRSYVEIYAPYIVSGIFLLLGASIIKQAFSGKEEATSPRPLTLATLLLIAIATSIDALAVGACLAIGELICHNICFSQTLLATVIIGLITVLLSLAGFHAATFLHRFPTRYLHMIAGLLLIILAMKQLISI